MSVLSWNRYGKSRIRLVKVRRAGGCHDIVDLTVDVQLEGAFERGLRRRRQRAVPGDRHDEEHRLRDRPDRSHRPRRSRSRCGSPTISPASRRSSASASASRSSAGTASRPAGRPHPHAFVQAGGEHWTTVVTRDRHAVRIVSGLARPGRPQDGRFGVLGISARRVHDAARDRRPDPRDLDHRVVDLPGGHDGLRRARAASAPPSSRRSRRTGADRCSTRSMRWARRRLRRRADATEITLTLPNRHHLLVDLAPFGLDNPNEIFVATDQPYGVIEATVRRSPAAPRYVDGRASRLQYGAVAAKRVSRAGATRSGRLSRAKDIMATDLSTTFTGVRIPRTRSCCRRRRRPNPSRTSCAPSRPAGAAS